MAKIKCASVGLNVDGTFIAWTGAVEAGIAFTGKSDETRLYVSPSYGYGGPAGAGAGIEVGIWTVKPKDLKGKSLVFAIGVAMKYGVEIQVIVDLNWNFLGFNIGPQVGAEFECSVSWTNTFVF